MKYIGENAIKKLISLIKGDLATKQPTITASGLLKGDGAGTVTSADTQEATLVDVPNGLLKGDGTTISQAVAGTDYMAPVSGGTTGQVLTKTADGQEWQSINKNNIGLGNVDNVKQYSVDNPPPYPVTSVNGATGEVKGTFYVTVTQGDNNSVTADKTAAEVYDAHAAGYAVYAITKFPGMNVPFVLPLVVGVDTGDIILLGFSTIGSLSPDTPPNYPVVAYDGTTGKWVAWIGTLAGQDDIPKESFVITFSASGSGSSIIYSCDKTYADILAAYNDGRPLVASIPVYKSGTWSGFRTNDFSYKATAELFSPARFEFSMVYEEDDPDNLDMTAVVARLYSNDEVSIVKLPLQKKLDVSGIVKGAYNGVGGYNYSAAVAGTDYMAPATNEAQAEEGQVLTKRGDGYIWKNAPSGLPTVTTEDNGKFLCVVNGAWAAVAYPSAEDSTF